MRAPRESETGHPGAAERATFIVRLWRRSSREQWKGQVEHVQSGERLPALSLAAALVAVRRWLADLGTRKGGADQ